MKRTSLTVSLCLFLMAGLYNLWTLRTVKMLYVYSDAGSTVAVVVDHLPWTDRDKINWFLAQKETLKIKYPLFDDAYHTYYIMSVGNGFTNYDKSPHEDLLCFPTINDNDNCIVKEHILIVDDFPDDRTIFYVSPDWVGYQFTSEKILERIPQS